MVAGIANSQFSIFNSCPPGRQAGRLPHNDRISLHGRLVGQASRLPNGNIENSVKSHRTQLVDQTELVAA